MISFLNLTAAHLIRARLEFTNLHGATLNGTILKGTYIHNTLLVDIFDFYNLDLNLDSNTDFKNSVINNPSLLDCLHHCSCKNIPKITDNKIELEKRLRAVSYLKNRYVDHILEFALLIH